MRESVRSVFGDPVPPCYATREMRDKKEAEA